MLSNQRLSIRVLAGLIIAAFGLQDLGFASPDLGASALSARPLPAVSLQDVIQNPAKLSIPFEFSHLKEIHPGTNGKLIVHIQDAHANFSGQMSMAKTLDQLMTTYGQYLVLAEGAAKDATLTDLRAIAGPSTWKIAAKRFLQDSVIAGEEYLNLTTHHPMRIRGVEYQNLYDEALKTYAELVDKRKEVLIYLHRIHVSMDRLKSKHYSQELLNYEKKIYSREGGAPDVTRQFEELMRLLPQAGMNLAPFPEVAKLQALKDTEKSLAFDKANLEQEKLLSELSQKGLKDQVQKFLELSQKTRNERISQSVLLDQLFDLSRSQGMGVSAFPELSRYRDYLKSFAALNLEALLQETESLEDAVYKSLLLRDDARKLRALDRFVGLLDKAYRIQMSSSDFKMLAANRDDFQTASWQAFLNDQLVKLSYFEDLVPFKPYFEEAAKPLFEFYRLVDERDRAFLENTGRILQEEKASMGYLVAGGYHTENLLKLFKKDGYSIVVLTPQVEYETDQNLYEKMLLLPFMLAKKKSEARERQTAKVLGFDTTPSKTTLVQELLAASPAAGSRLAAAYQSDSRSGLADLDLQKTQKVIGELAQRGKMNRPRSFDAAGISAFQGTRLSEAAARGARLAARPRDSEALEKFIEEHSTAPRRIGGGKVFMETPLPVLYGILDEIEKDLGSSKSKKLLDIGAGSLRSALLASSYGFDVTTVESDPGILEIASRNYREAKDRGLIDGEKFHFSEKAQDAFDLDWSGYDSVYFFYTQPAVPEEAARFRQRLVQKAGTLKPGALLAMALTSGQIAAGQHFVNELKDSFDLEVTQMAPSPEGGIYLHLYRPKPAGARLVSPIRSTKSQGARPVEASTPEHYSPFQEEGAERPLPSFNQVLSDTRALNDRVRKMSAGKITQKSLNELGQLLTGEASFAEGVIQRTLRNDPYAVFEKMHDLLVSKHTPFLTKEVPGLAEKSRDVGIDVAIFDVPLVSVKQIAKNYGIEDSEGFADRFKQLLLQWSEHVEAPDTRVSGMGPRIMILGATREWLEKDLSDRIRLAVEQVAEEYQASNRLSPDKAAAMIADLDQLRFHTAHVFAYLESFSKKVPAKPKMIRRLESELRDHDTFNFGDKRNLEKRFNEHLKIRRRNSALLARYYLARSAAGDTTAREKASLYLRNYFIPDIYQKLNERIEALENLNSDLYPKLRREVDRVLDVKNTPLQLFDDHSIRQIKKHLARKKNKDVRPQLKVLYSLFRQGRLYKTTPILNYHDGKLPRPFHRWDSLVRFHGAPLYSALNRLKEAKTKDERAVILVELKKAYIHYRVHFYDALVRSTRNERLEEVTRLSAIDQVVEARHSGEYARLQEELKDMALSLKRYGALELGDTMLGDTIRRLRELTRPDVDVYKRDVGDEIGIRIGDQYVRMGGGDQYGFIELNDGNAAQKHIQPDQRDSWFHEVILSLHRRAVELSESEASSGRAMGSFLNEVDLQIQSVTTRHYPELYFQQLKKVPVGSSRVQRLPVSASIDQKTKYPRYAHRPSSKKGKSEEYVQKDVFDSWTLVGKISKKRLSRTRRPYTVTVTAARTRKSRAAKPKERPSEIFFELGVVNDAQKKSGKENRIATDQDVLPPPAMDEKLQTANRKILDVVLDRGQKIVGDFLSGKVSSRSTGQSLKSTWDFLESQDAWVVENQVRVAENSVRIALALAFSEYPKISGKFSQWKDIDQLITLYVAGYFHDIGKSKADLNEQSIRIGDHSYSILSKPDLLTPEEYAKMREHVGYGRKIMRGIPAPVYRKHGLNQNEIVRIIYGHHRGFDDRGYPHSLKVKDVPLASRILSVADSVDAILDNNRKWNGRVRTLEDAVNEISAGAMEGRYDSDIVRAMLQILIHEGALSPVLPARPEGARLASEDAPAQPKESYVRGTGNYVKLVPGFLSEEEARELGQEVFLTHLERGGNSLHKLKIDRSSLPQTKDEAAVKPSVRLVGEGAGSAVYAVEIPGDQPRQIAALVRKPGRGEDYLATFHNLIAINPRGDRSDVPNVKGFVDVMQPLFDPLDPEFPYEATGSILFMDLFPEGGSLMSLPDVDSLTPEKKFDVLKQIAGTLQYVHGLGRLHRDLKPENVWLTKDGRVIVYDFGVSDPDKPSMTSTAPYSYLPPEIINNLSAIHAFDKEVRDEFYASRRLDFYGFFMTAAYLFGLHVSDFTSEWHMAYTRLYHQGRAILAELGEDARKEYFESAEANREIEIFDPVLNAKVQADTSTIKTLNDYFEKIDRGEAASSVADKVLSRMREFMKNYRVYQSIYQNPQASIDAILEGSERFRALPEDLQTLFREYLRLDPLQMPEGDWDQIIDVLNRSGDVPARSVSPALAETGAAGARFAKTHLGETTVLQDEVTLAGVYRLRIYKVAKGGTLELEPLVPGVKPRIETFTGGKEVISIGRNILTPRGLRVEDKRVSQNHLMVMPTNGGWEIMDLESTNGTKINGIPIRPGTWYSLNFSTAWQKILTDLLLTVASDTDGRLEKILQMHSRLGDLLEEKNPKAFASTQALTGEIGRVLRLEDVRNRPLIEWLYVRIGLLAHQERLAAAIGELQDVIHGVESVESADIARMTSVWDDPHSSDELGRWHRVLLDFKKETWILMRKLMDLRADKSNIASCESVVKKIDALLKAGQDTIDQKTLKDFPWLTELAILFAGQMDGEPFEQTWSKIVGVKNVLLTPRAAQQILARVIHGDYLERGENFRKLLRKINQRHEERVIEIGRKAGIDPRALQDAIKRENEANDRHVASFTAAYNRLTTDAAFRSRLIEKAATPVVGGQFRSKHGPIASLAEIKDGVVTVVFNDPSQPGTVSEAQTTNVKKIHDFLAREFEKGNFDMVAIPDSGARLTVDNAYKSFRAEVRELESDWKELKFAAPDLFMRNQDALNEWEQHSPQISEIRRLMDVFNENPIKWRIASEVLIEAFVSYEHVWTLFNNRLTGFLEQDDPPGASKIAQSLLSSADSAYRHFQYVSIAWFEFLAAGKQTVEAQWFAAATALVLMEIMIHRIQWMAKRIPADQQGALSDIETRLHQIGDRLFAVRERLGSKNPEPLSRILPEVAELIQSSQRVFKQLNSTPWSGVSSIALRLSWLESDSIMYLLTQMVEPVDQPVAGTEATAASLISVDRIDFRQEPDSPLMISVGNLSNVRITVKPSGQDGYALYRADMPSQSISFKKNAIVRTEPDPADPHYSQIRVSLDEDPDRGQKIYTLFDRILQVGAPKTIKLEVVPGEPGLISITSEGGRALSKRLSKDIVSDEALMRLVSSNGVRDVSQDVLRALDDFERKHHLNVYRYDHGKRTHYFAVAQDSASLLSLEPGNSRAIVHIGGKIFFRSPEALLKKFDLAVGHRMPGSDFGARLAAPAARSARSTPEEFIEEAARQTQVLLNGQTSNGAQRKRRKKGLVQIQRAASNFKNPGFKARLFHIVRIVGHDQFILKNDPKPAGLASDGVLIRSEYLLASMSRWQNLGKRNQTHLAALRKTVRDLLGIKTGLDRSLLEASEKGIEKSERERYLELYSREINRLLHLALTGGHVSNIRPAAYEQIVKIGGNFKNRIQKNRFEGDALRADLAALQKILGERPNIFDPESAVKQALIRKIQVLEALSRPYRQQTLFEDPGPEEGARLAEIESMTTETLLRMLLVRKLMVHQGASIRSSLPPVIEEELIRRGTDTLDVLEKQRPLIMEFSAPKDAFLMMPLIVLVAAIASKHEENERAIQTLNFLKDLAERNDDDPVVALADRQIEHLGARLTRGRPSQERKLLKRAGAGAITTAPVSTVLIGSGNAAQPYYVSLRPGLPETFASPKEFRAAWEGPAVSPILDPTGQPWQSAPVQAGEIIPLEQMLQGLVRTFRGLSGQRTLLIALHASLLEAVSVDERDAFLEQFSKKVAEESLGKVQLTLKIYRNNPRSIYKKAQPGTVVAALDAQGRLKALRNRASAYAGHGLVGYEDAQNGHYPDVGRALVATVQLLLTDPRDLMRLSESSTGRVWGKNILPEVFSVMQKFENLPDQLPKIIRNALPADALSADIRRTMLSILETSWSA